jgi:hypothetical protein
MKMPVGHKFLKVLLLKLLQTCNVLLTFGFLIIIGVSA